MLTAFQALHVLLIFSLVLDYTVEADTGCADWSLSGTHDVCCKRCKPGNRLVQKCGSDPKNLCTPCTPGTYLTNLTQDHCLRCTQCIGVQNTVKPCTISSDTVCGCQPGFRCGNDRCSFCVTECKEGEEPTEDRLCKKCPKGKFNDKIHSMCKEWKTSCLDGQILGKGNATSDRTCTYSHEETLTTFSVIKKEETNTLPVFIVGGMAGLAVLCIMASVAAYVKTQNKMEKKPETDILDQEHSDDSSIIVVEQEDCSCHRPEQEQGGSTESISTQDSESKLIV
ncbi:tumor necrosis factor receptor superfamily member 9a isoform X2 [Pseudorasbora parva]